jgi:hypothetical protein
MSTQVVETKVGSFVREDCMDNNSQCRVSITIKTLQYECGNQYFDIRYTYHYTGNQATARQLVPFKGDIDLETHSEGDIVKKNPMTEQMIAYLLAIDTKTSEISGHIMPTDYKSNIMVALAHFWD